MRLSKILIVLAVLAFLTTPAFAQSRQLGEDDSARDNTLSSPPDSEVVYPHTYPPYADVSPDR